MCIKSYGAEGADLEALGGDRTLNPGGADLTTGLLVGDRTKTGDPLMIGLALVLFVFTRL